MNHTQRKYAMERVESIAKYKIAAIKDKHTTKGVCLSSQERVALVRKGKVKLRPDNCINYKSCGYFSDHFDFSRYESSNSFNQAAFDKEIKPISLKAQEIKDQLMLGDAEQALKQIQDFEK
jgi:hypothetical protein